MSSLFCEMILRGWKFYYLIKFPKILLPKNTSSWFFEVSWAAWHALYPRNLWLKTKVWQLTQAWTLCWYWGLFAWLHHHFFYFNSVENFLTTYYQISALVLSFELESMHLPFCQQNSKTSKEYRVLCHQIQFYSPRSCSHNCNYPLFNFKLII